MEGLLIYRRKSRQGDNDPISFDLKHRQSDKGTFNITFKVEESKGSLVGKVDLKLDRISDSWSRTVDVFTSDVYEGFYIYEFIYYNVKSGDYRITATAYDTSNKPIGVISTETLHVYDDLVSSYTKEFDPSKVETPGVSVGIKETEEDSVIKVSPNVQITLRTTPNDAIIYYTLDGKDPLVYGTKYTDPFAITDTYTIKAIGTKPHMENSEVETKSIVMLSGLVSSSSGIGLSIPTKWTGNYVVPGVSETITATLTSANDVESYTWYDNGMPIPPYAVNENKLYLGTILGANYNLTVGNHIIKCEAKVGETTYSIEYLIVVSEEIDAVGTIGPNYSDRNYTVGSTGPAGGTIFYDVDVDNNDDFYSDELCDWVTNPDGLTSSECGWRFLEAAPDDTIWTDYTYVFGSIYDENNGIYLYSNGKNYWGVKGTEDYCTYSEIGCGWDNTKRLMETMKNYKVVDFSNNTTTIDNYAIKVCFEYEVNLDNDTNFKDWFIPSLEELKFLLDIKGLGSKSPYWSSSEHNGDSPVMVYSWPRDVDGEFKTDSKVSLYVHPARRF